MTGEEAAGAEIEAAIEAFTQRARTLQMHLRAAGYYSDEVDGDWGPRSRRALRQYGIERKGEHPG